MSSAVRDTGFRLGIQGIEEEADRLAMTAVQVEVTATATAAAPPVTFVRFGLWDEAYDAGQLRNDAAEQQLHRARPAEVPPPRARPLGEGHLSAN